MKKSHKISICILIVLFLAIQIQASEHLEAPPILHPITVSTIKADVNRDNIKETVKFTGFKTGPCSHVQNPTVTIYDNAGAKVLKKIPIKYGGFGPEMIVKNVDNDEKYNNYESVTYLTNDLDKLNITLKDNKAIIEMTVDSSHSQCEKFLLRQY
jgi:hypothetical protein